MSAQPSCDVRENGVTVVQLDGKRRARKDLLDRAENLERLFLRVLRGLWSPFPTVFLSALGSPVIRYRRYSPPGLS
jgi:hypothetical protein